MTDSQPSPRVVVCPSCVVEKRAQRTEYDLRCHWYVCLVHGPILTGEAIHDMTGGRRVQS